MTALPASPFLSPVPSGEKPASGPKPPNPTDAGSSSVSQALAARETAAAVSVCGPQRQSTVAADNSPELPQFLDRRISKPSTPPATTSSASVSTIQNSNPIGEAS